MGSRAEGNGEFQLTTQALESLTRDDKIYLEGMTQELFKLARLLDEQIIPNTEAQKAKSLPRQTAWQQLDIIRLNKIPNKILELLKQQRYFENSIFLEELNHKNNTELAAEYHQKPLDLLLKVRNLRSVLLFFLNYRK